MTIRTLILMRHSKSDWPMGVADHERPLSDRGRRDARVAGELLSALVGSVDEVLVSTALRTRQTWEITSEGLTFRRMGLEPRIYEASPRSLLSVIQGSGADVETLMLVGHNPGTEYLADSLAGQGDAQALADMRWKYPTSGIAVLETQSTWAELGPSDAALKHFLVPRG